MYLAVVDCLQALLWIRLLIGTLLDIWGYFWLNPHVVYVSWKYQGFPHKEFVYWQLSSLIIDAAVFACSLVPASTGTASIRAAGRLIIALGLLWRNPDSLANFLIVFALLLVIWSVSDTIKYLYYFTSELQLRFYGLQMLWHNQFIVMYPMTMVCQSYLTSIALQEIWGSTSWLLLFVVVLIYGFGYSWLFLHLWEQRDKHCQHQKAMHENNEKAALADTLA